MSDPLRTDIGHARRCAGRPSDRDAKIEQLLLVGLDHYFAAHYEHAINVWTRALFLDRSHARARAYIERARSALAERQRESEELLQNGVAAFQRGDGDEARRLLQAAIDGGAPSEEALAVLDRLNRSRRRCRPPARRIDRLPRAGAALSRAVARRSRSGGAGRVAVVALSIARRWRRVCGLAAWSRLRSVFGIRSVLALAGRVRRAGHAGADAGRARGRRCRCRAAAR